MARRSWYPEFYVRSQPRAVRGGIKAQSRRGSIGESWWAQRWISVLEGFDIGGRLGRGRAYARRGQVMDLQIGGGRVTALVQGSQRRPYEVEIKIRPLAGTARKKVAAELSRQAAHAAKLLAGEMPQDIEAIFAKAGLCLFPDRAADLKTECSCPDWSNPCKHIAAVYYLLGEAFDRDPFLLFTLRGIDRKALLRGLGGAAAPGLAPQPAPVAAPQPAPVPGPETAAAPPTPQPLPREPEAFWRGRAVPADLLGPVAPPPLPAPLLRQLGSFPLWRGEERFLDALEPVYREAGRHAMNVFLRCGPTQ